MVILFALVIVLTSAYNTPPKSREVNESNVFPRMKRNNQGERLVEYAVVIDKVFFETYNKNETLILQNVQHIISQTNDFFYSTVNIRIVLTHLIFWYTNEINIVSDPSTTLKNFATWVKITSDLKRFDFINLFTTSIFRGAGYVYIGSMCNGHYSSAVSDLANFEVDDFIKMNIRILGMSMGARREDQNEHSICKDSNCLLDFSKDISNIDKCWSPCSKSSIEDFLNNIRSACLENISPICGNFIIEENEECDCGPYCPDTCCSSKTCTHSSIGTVCRASAHECDKEEVCTGESVLCPLDSPMKNGVPCNDYKSMCYNGKCESQEAHCKELYGEFWIRAKDSCFDKNLVANNRSHCGIKDQISIPCNKSDKQCGTLHCTKPTEPNACYIRPSSSSGYILANDGSKCAENKQCISQKCVTTSFWEYCQYNCQFKEDCVTFKLCKDTTDFSLVISIALNIVAIFVIIFLCLGFAIALCYCMNSSEISS